MDQFVIERGSGRIEEYYREMPAVPGTFPHYRWTEQQSHATRFASREEAETTARALRDNHQGGSISVAQLLPSEV